MEDGTVVVNDIVLIVTFYTFLTLTVAVTFGVMMYHVGRYRSTPHEKGKHRRH